MRSRPLRPTVMTAAWVGSAHKGFSTADDIGIVSACQTTIPSYENEGRIFNFLSRRQQGMPHILLGSQVIQISKAFPA
jgi:hypothetical protein